MSCSQFKYFPSFPRDLYGTQKQFSTVDLINLLDQTKSEVFNAFKKQNVDNLNAYFYVPTLFDQLMQQIFAGCWGIADQPTPDDTINHLKGVYGRVISGLAAVHEYYPLHIIKSLESKKERSASIDAAHFTALQECAASVYNNLRSASGVEARSVESTLRKIGYQNPLDNIRYDLTNYQTLAWSLINPEWNPIKNTQDVLERVKTALALDTKFGNAQDVELASEQFGPFHFSTAAKFKGKNGFQRIVWSTQKPDCSFEIQDLGDIHLDGFLYSTGKTLAWQSPDRKWHLMSFKGTGVDRCLESLYPGQGYEEPLSYACKEGTLEIKVKKTEVEKFEYWSYNTDTESWKQLSEDERELSSDEAKAYLKAQYPGIGINFFSYSSNEILTSLCDPKTVTQERFVIFSRNPGACTYSERQLFVAQADSIKFFHDARLMTFKDLGGKFCAKKLVKDVLENTLPPHESIENWDEAEFNSRGDFLFASRIKDYGRKIEYWTLKADQWDLQYDGEIWSHSLNKINLANTGGVYKSIYSDAGLTLEFLNPGTLSFESTNVKDIPVCLTDHENGGIIVSKTDARSIVAVKDYKNGQEEWCFLDENIRKQYDSFLRKLRAKWTAEGRKFATAPLTVLEFKLNDNQICEITFFFHQNMAINGLASLNEEEVFVEWPESFDKVIHTLHPPLQTQKVKVDDHDVPYYYVPPVKDSNQKTLILMEGGPPSHYKGGFSDIIHHYTQNGWRVIIPQESLRTGYGWKHFAKGLGEMGRKNLHQLLHIFYDAKVKGLIPDIKQVSLYGQSYGGFVAASFALRWSELHKEAGLEQKFHFQSIVADAAWVNWDSDPATSAIALPDDIVAGGKDSIEDYSRKIIPIHRVKDPLSARLYLVHGNTDVRCSAADIKHFKQALTKADKNVPLYWHQGAHTLPEHTRYPEFLAALMEGKPTGELEKEIGLSVE